MKPYGFVYLIRNSVNGKVYIGQTVTTPQQRWAQHKHRARTGYQRRLYNAMRKYGVEHFVLVVIHQAFSRGELDEMEVRAIYTHKSDDRRFGYNMTAGADNGVNAEEAREKISSSKRGIPKSDEHRHKLRLANIGKPMPEVTRRALAAANTGRVWSKDVRDKISNTHRGKTMSTASRLKMSAAKLGKPWTEARRRAFDERKRKSACL